MDRTKKEWKVRIDQGIFDLSVIREYREEKQKHEEVRVASAWYYS